MTHVPRIWREHRYPWQAVLKALDTRTREARKAAQAGIALAALTGWTHGSGSWAAGSKRATGDAALIAMMRNNLDSLLDVVEAARTHRCYSTPETTSEEGTAFCPLCEALARLDEEPRP